MGGRCRLSHRHRKKDSPPAAGQLHFADRGVKTSLREQNNVSPVAGDTTEERRNSLFFPSWIPYVVWIATLVLRTAHVVQPVNWWVLHPDEIFQSSEVAHTEVYGFGFRAYEFTSVKNEGVAAGAGGNVSLFRQRELQLGMRAMRSALYPRFFVLVSGLADLLGVEVKPFVLWRASHAAVASLLPLSVYRFSRAFFRCNETGRLAAILTACSLHLNVLGTHPLVNSFLAPGIFWAASVFCSVFNERPSFPETSRGHPSAPADANARVHEAACATSQRFSRPREEVLFRLQQDGGILSGRKSESSRGCVTSAPEVRETWANRRFPNAGNLKSGDSEETAAPPWTSGVAVRDQVTNLMEHTSFILCGLVAALCIYIRVDTALFLGVMLLPSYSKKTVNHAHLLKCVIGACAGTGLGLIVDFRFYGEIVATPINWAKFNIFDDFSSKYFSSSSFFKYFDELFVRDKGQSMLGIISVAGLAILICENRKSSGKKTEKESDENQVALVLRLTFSWLFLLLVYSCKGHKEVRFVHNVIVLILVTSASVVCQTVATWRQNVGGNFLHALKIVWLCLALHAALQWKMFPSARDGSNQSWAYHGTWDSHDINACLAYVGEQTDVTGVFLDRNLHVTGGYSLLHRDIPILTFLTHEFVEFDASSKITLPEPALLFPGKNISFLTFDNPSNYVSVQNAPYLVKLLIQKRNYNYVIITRKRRFVSLGYETVFEQGTMRVMKRTFHPDHERQLLEKAARAPTGVNATVLQYEGDVLFRFQKFRLAAERYHAALSLGVTHAQTYQGLAACARELGDQAEAMRWTKECIEKFGQLNCRKPLGITNINPDRRLI